MASLTDTKAVLLVGGLGTRLRTVVSSAPKVLASVGNRSFLDLLVLQLRTQGIRRLVMCTGYMADQIEHAFGDGRATDISVEYSKESQPMGTAGALKLASPMLQALPYFLLMNGDSFLEIDFEKLLSFHQAKQAPVTIAVVKVANTSRYGSMVIDADYRVTRFQEKTGKEIPGIVNAGVYVINRDVLAQIPDGPGSLEKDVFPRLIELGIYAFESNGVFIDIGTPEDYAKAQAMRDRLESAASHA